MLQLCLKQNVFCMTKKKQVRYDVKQANAHAHLNWSVTCLNIWGFQTTRAFTGTF